LGFVLLLHARTTQYALARTRELTFLATWPTSTPKQTQPPKRPLPPPNQSPNPTGNRSTRRRPRSRG
jgi:hypothetical protein